jgi:DNA polymerase-3 subunit alpha
MSKKKASVMEAERADFILGCAEHGVDSAVAESIFEEMVGFAQYAFNKSHATAYGILSYRTAYLKAHYPSEYYAALLTSVLDSSTKVREYIVDAQKVGVSVLPPDINNSHEMFSTDGKNIRFGLLAIKNVGRTFASAIIEERKNGKFKSFDDFVRRMINSDINKRTLESMIKCGAFDSLGTTRSSLTQCFEIILDGAHEKVRNNISGQMDMFSLAVSSSLPDSSYSYPDIAEYSLRELLLLEKESSGMYFSGHMIDDYSNNVEKINPDRISDILSAFSDGADSESKYTDRASVRIVGIITDKRTKITKNGDTMAFLTIDDSYGEIEVIVFAKRYSSFAELLYSDNAIFVEGTVSVEDDDSPRILLNSAQELVSNSEYTRTAEIKEAAEKRLFIKIDSVSDKRETICKLG